MVLPASVPRPDPDPLFYLAGYGGAATDPGTVQWAAGTFAEVNQTRDLVFVDQRGVGRSAPQTCPGSMEDPALSPDRVRAAVRTCLAAAPRTPRYDTTPSAVRDLDRVRAALGYRQIDLYGGSYGVTLGLAYLQRYDRNVRTAVLDSGSLLDVRLWQLVPTSAQQAFDRLAERCAQDRTCAAAYGPAPDLATVLAALRAQPARVVIAGRTVTVDEASFLNMVIDGYLGSAETAVLLPADLHALALGQWSTVVERRQLSGQLPSAAKPIPMQKITVGCSDAWARMDPAAIAAQSASSFPPATLAQASWWNAVCAGWSSGAGASGAVRTTVPVVFLNGTADPADPPANVAAAAATMPNALLVSVPGGAHGVLTGCMRSYVTLFVTSGKAGDPAEWSACARAVGAQLPPFPPPS
jgi:pimeloyl-ACP methyl ester carboxylesterase